MEFKVGDLVQLKRGKTRNTSKTGWGAQVTPKTVTEVEVGKNCDVRHCNMHVHFKEHHFNPWHCNQDDMQLVEEEFST